jgi:hypothetical protein
MAHGTELTLPTREAVAPGARTVDHGSHCTWRSELTSLAMEATAPEARSAVHGGGGPNLRVTILMRLPCWGARAAARQVFAGLSWGRAPPDRSYDAGAVHQVSKAERRWSGSATK